MSFESLDNSSGIGNAGNDSKEPQSGIEQLKPQRSKLPKLNRMEHLLQMWEDLWYVPHLMNRVIRHETNSDYYPMAGALANARHFRDFLMGKRHDLSIKDFWVPLFDVTRSNPLFRMVGEVYPWIADWVRDSRRCYSVTEDLQLLLNHTSLQGIRWTDIKLPFDCFLVQLATPLTYLDRQYDLLLVSRNAPKEQDGKHSYTFMFLGSSIDRYHEISRQDKERYSREIANGRGKQVLQECGKIYEPIMTCMDSILVTCEEREQVLESVSGFEIKEEDLLHMSEPGQQEATRTVLQDGIRIAVGLSLYLRSLPTSSSHISNWQPIRSGKPDKKAVLNHGEVCTISSIYRLSPEELTTAAAAASPGGYELRCHFRAGHWRKPPGFGLIPEAEKTIWVRPTLVRSDRLIEGTLPGGTEVVL